MAILRISDLKLRTIIGTQDWERAIKQDVVINVNLKYNAQRAIRSDCLKGALDYKAITKKIITAVENNQFHLLEKLTDHVLKLIMKESQVKAATVRIDKPGALRFADSVSVELNAKRQP